MESFFEYRRLGSDFRTELLDLIEQQESVVLLGPRNSGKLYLLRETEKSLPRENICLRVEFSNNPPIEEANRIREIIRQSITACVPTFPAASDQHSMLGSLDSLCSSSPRRVIFMASNIDSLAHHLAHQFLREIRVLCQRETGRLTAILTGEENLRDLVWGPDSEFNTAHQYVLQGYDLNEFTTCLQNRHETDSIPKADAIRCFTALFDVTGGSVYMSRAILWAWMENQRQISRPLIPVETETQAFLEFIQRPLIKQFESMSVMDRSEIVVSQDPPAWRDLHQLIRGETVTVTSPNSEPTVLELAGIAVREAQQLRFASPMTAQLAKSRYGDTQFGDLYAIHGDWETANTFYRQIPVQNRIRPNGSDDRIQLSHVLKALGGKMNSVATSRGKSGANPTDRERLKQVKRLFVDGCTLLLGASEVTFWSDQRESFPKVARSSSEDWSVADTDRIPAEVADYGKQLLRSLPSNELGWHNLKTSSPFLARRGAVALLPTLHSSRRDAVMVSNIRHGVSFSRDCYNLLMELLEQFTNAYDHIIANMALIDRLTARENHLRVATGIINALGKTVRNPREALTSAATELLKLGFKRIMFALVDPARKRIRGISQAVGEQCGADLAEETNYVIGKLPYADIQPWIVATKQHVIVDDWRTWNTRQHDFPPLNEVLCEKAEMKSFGVVPMLIRKSLPNHDSEEEVEEEVFGTIHFEMKTGLSPSKDDIDDMLEFGRQMAAAVSQSERVDVLLATLNSDPDSIVIFDHHQHVRFVNESAANRFGIPPGWRDSHLGIRLADQESLGLEKFVSDVIQTGKRSVRHIANENQSESLFGLPLRDWRDVATIEETLPTLGATLIIRDLTPLHKVFSALLKIARRASDSENTAEVTLSGINDLGYPKSRLYRIETTDPNVMFSAKSTGLPENFRQQFDRGEFRSIRGCTGHEPAWSCIDDGQPALFLWDPTSEDGTFKVTSHGLKIRVVKNPAFKGGWKREGDSWIDLPLIAHGKIIGKLSIDCGSNDDCGPNDKRGLKPEQFELLKLFSALLGALLDALDKKERWMRDASESAIARCAHTIRTKLAGLSDFSRRYSEAAPGNEGVLEWNRIHQSAIEGSMNAVERVVEIFGKAIKLKPQIQKMKPLFNEVLTAHTKLCGLETFDADTLICLDDLQASIDPDCIRIAIEELLANSRQMAPELKSLIVQIEAVAERRGTEDWLSIIVRDNGVGISPDRLDKIFEPFYSHRPDGHPGSGLGLNYVRRIIETHGGEIHSRSALASGAIFSGAIFVINIPNKGMV